MHDRIMLWLSSGKRIDGLWVGTYYQTNADQVMRRVEDGLSLIKQCDPKTYNRIVRDLKRIWVIIIASSAGEYRNSIEACVLDERFVLADATDAELIAGAIVHEATHARLWRCGIGYEEHLRQRVEAACFRQMLAFARHLPNGQGVREWAEAGLGASQATWTDAGMLEQQLEDVIPTMRHLGAEWLGRIMLPILKWRAFKSRKR